jgi:hypothetical protein
LNEAKLRSKGKMTTLLKLLTVPAAVFTAVAQQVSAGTILLGTTGAGAPPFNKDSQLVEIDPATGALLRTAPSTVGFTVNGLAWDAMTMKLYATTSVNDPTFHGLIVIDPLTGVGTPVDKTIVNS